MAYDSTHPVYDSRLKQWQKCRDAYEGEDAIKAAGVKYLPRLKGQTDDDYVNYKMRAMFYSITSKSVAAMVGMATMRDPKISYPTAMEQHFKGVNPPQFSEVFSSILIEVLLQSRCGILIDSPKSGGDPKPSIYRAEDIINWRENEDSGELEMVMLCESYTKIIDDYNSEPAIRFRELRMVDGQYIQIVHESGADDVIYEPQVMGLPMTAIPFYMINPFGMGFTDYKPMMLDIANINLSHYLSSADLEHGRHFTGLPTPVVIGADTSTDLYIGSTKFLIIPDKGGDAKYLEFTGQGLQSLEKAMSEKQSQLASLSARLLDNSTRGSESTDAVKLRYMSETASLTTVIRSISLALNTIYKRIADILREDPDDVSIVLDTEFMDSSMTPAEMTALFNGYLEGAISVNTLVYNLRKGRRLDPDVEDSDEIKIIEARLKELKELKASKTVTSRKQTTTEGE